MVKKNRCKKILSLQNYNSSNIDYYFMQTDFGIEIIFGENLKSPYWRDYESSVLVFEILFLNGPKNGEVSKLLSDK